MAESIDIRVRLQGGRVVAAEAEGVAHAVDDIGDAATRSSGRLGALRASAAGLSGPLRSLGGATRTGALYLGGFSAAVAGVGAAIGVKFDSDLEQASISMTHFLGSGKAAKKYLDDLYVLAAHTPFEFRSLTQTAEQFMAFGYSAKGARDMLTSLADAAAGLGKSNADLAPVTLALGQIKAAGSLKGQDLNQLTSFGISATGIAKNLGMTYREMRKAMEGGKVGSEDALRAIRKTMDQQFHGLAKAQSKTFAGQLSTLQDMSMRTLGKVAKPLFDWLRNKGLPGLNKALPGIARGIGKVFGWLGKTVPKVIAAVRKGFASVMETIRPATPFLQNVLLPLLKGLAIGIIGSVVGALKVAAPVLKAFFQVLGWIGTKAAPLRSIIQGIGVAIGFVFGGPILKAIGALGKFGGVFRVVGVAAHAFAAPVRAVGASFGFVLRMGGRFVGFFGGLAGKVLPGLGRAFSAIGRFIGNLGGRFVESGKGIGKAVLRGIRNAFGAGMGFVHDLGKALVNTVIGFLNSAIPNKIPIPGAPDIPLPDNPIPKLAKGGLVSGRGSWITGEAGPELNTLSGGRVLVQPLSHAGPMAPLLAGALAVTVPVHLDGRVITEVVAKHVGDRRNRK